MVGLRLEPGRLLLEPCSSPPPPLPPACLCYGGLPRSLRCYSDAAWLTARCHVLGRGPKKHKFPLTALNLEAFLQMPSGEFPITQPFLLPHRSSQRGPLPMPHTHLLPAFLPARVVCPHLRSSPCILLSFKSSGRHESHSAASGLQNPRRSVLD